MLPKAHKAVRAQECCQHEAGPQGPPPNTHRAIGQRHTLQLSCFSPFRSSLAAASPVSCPHLQVTLGLGSLLTFRGKAQIITLQSLSSSLTSPAAFSLLIPIKKFLMLPKLGPSGESGYKEYWSLLLPSGPQVSEEGKLPFLSFGVAVTTESSECQVWCPRHSLPISQGSH